MLVFSQGACVGMLSSLLFILWMGMGQIVAQYLGTYSVATKETVVMGCPTEWLADADTSSDDDFPEYELQKTSIKVFQFPCEIGFT